MQNQAAEETYRDIENMIHQLCWMAYRRWGGDIEEYESAANEAFAKAYNNFDPNNGTRFITYANRAIQNALFDHHDDEIKYSQRYGREIDETTSTRYHSRVDQILSNISQDARVIVQLILDTPEELKGLLSKRHPDDSRRIIWTHLQKLGWSMARVVQSFEEVKEVLQEV